ncbi:PepSY domain-containing protein [Vagococcus intermedius]|uniref:PepSY domain-containing protein n=1 Tax=Vagococcus intermedius TaxID=2991418 RepID=A0AAF0CT95_9ENTE|nr:PepSY domain-containing protein [Vagococcus intermedius]WEG72545.1 PepSY domain-containing protein [Vagococcus intermedius]WEG74631.1 PepSY domain-containing protein [Vagococcus intermedius]
MKTPTKFLTGLITGLSVLLLAGCQGNTNEDKVKNEDNTKTTAKEDKEKQVATLPQTNLEDVINLYEKNYPDSDISSIQIEKTRNDWEVEVEGLDDSKEYSLKLLDSSDKIINQKEEKLDQNEANGVKRDTDKLNLSELASLKEVTKHAQSEVPDGQLDEMELSQDLGINHWSLKILDGRKEVEVKIDAQTNKVISVEQDD